MPEGMTCILKVNLSHQNQEILSNINNLLENRDLSEVFAGIPSVGLNHLIYRCQSEENIISDGKRSPYGLHERGEFAFSGIASIMHIINNKNSSNTDAQEDYVALKKNM